MFRNIGRTSGLFDCRGMRCGRGFSNTVPSPSFRFLFVAFGRMTTGAGEAGINKGC